MQDPDDLPLPTTEGRRPSSTTGDRLMVGLAALALFGGALIAISKVLPQSDAPETSQTSASLEPTVEASRTPRPTPTPPPLRSFELVRGELLPPAAAIPEYFGGWIRALGDVTVWSTHRDGATRIGVLREGEAAYGSQAPEEHGGAAGWMQLEVPTSGWIRTSRAGQETVRRFGYFQTGTPSVIEALVPGPDGFVALGASSFDNQGGFEPLLAVSPDGRSWTQAEPPFPQGVYGYQLTYGPAGWLTMAHLPSDSSPALVWVLRSDDLSSWEVLGSIQEVSMIDSSPSQLVGTASGYIMLGSGRGGFGSQQFSIWFSTDGVLWSERRAEVDFSSQSATPRLFGTPLGFYLHSSPESLMGGTPPVAAFSPDGWTWSTVATEASRIAGVAASGEDLLAIDTTSRGDARVWRGTIVGETLSWEPDPEAGSAFAGAAVTAVVGDGTRIAAFGWERKSDAPLWWLHEGSGWERRGLPADYQGIPRTAAAGLAGFVLLGSRPSNPLLWHLAGRTWAPEATPLIDVAPGLDPEQCAALAESRVDPIDVMNGVGPLWADCFGDAPITFTAYSHACNDCYYGRDGRSEPAWLASPSEDNQLFLSAIETAGWSWLEAVLRPGLERDPSWTDRWVTVTGHFDDPAAQTCRHWPTIEAEPWYFGRQQTILECRNRFVVTRVRVVPTEE